MVDYLGEMKARVIELERERESVLMNANALNGAALELRAWIERVEAAGKDAEAAKVEEGVPV
jgi:hypothetical protein